MAKVLEIRGEFEFVIWRSLRHAPPFSQLIDDLLQFLSQNNLANPPGRTDEGAKAALSSAVFELMAVLGDRRCLLVLDDLEMIMDSGELAGHYRPGYKDYGQFIKYVGQSPLHSCLLLVSREKPIEISYLAGDSVRCQQLGSLDPESAKFILTERGLSANAPGISELIRRYNCNPGALKIAATTILELFDGNVSLFLREEDTLIVGDVLGQLLSQQLQRLSELQREILYCLAIESNLISLSQLQERIWYKLSGKDLVAALEYLRRRSLVEKISQPPEEPQFTLQPLVGKYVITQFARDLDDRQGDLTPEEPQLTLQPVVPKYVINQFVRDLGDRQDDSILLDLFSRLREAGLPLGIEQYLLLLRALQGGFGLDRPALKRLCKMLWVKSAEDDRIFEDCFERLVPAPEPQEIEVKSPEPELSPSTAPPVVESIPKPELPLSSELALEIDDEVQVAKSALRINQEKDISDSRFILTGEYFPVTQRQMKQIWRYLRRPIRSGPPVELDLEATVARVGREGIFLAPVLVPQRVNRAELLLLLDRDGSMVPFHGLSQRLAETAVRGGRLGRAEIYYFHNCVLDYLYSDPYRQNAELVSNLLPRLGRGTAALIFSDAGAARGGYNGQRFELTENFLNKLKERSRYIAWLNPMPSSRWQGTTAGEIARLVPMFELSRRGLQDAVNILRGR